MVYETSAPWVAQLLSNATDDAARVQMRAAMEACPYWSFVGPVPLASAGFDVLARHVGGVFMLPDLVPAAIDPARMADIQGVLLESKAVFIIARNNEVGEHAQREIMAWYRACPGFVQ